MTRARRLPPASRLVAPGTPGGGTTRLSVIAISFIMRGVTWRRFMKTILRLGVGTQNGPRYTLRFCRAFDGAHLAKRSERGGWRIGIGPEVIAGEIDMLPTER